MNRRLGAAALAVALALPLAAAPAQAEDGPIQGTEGWPASSVGPLGELSSIEQSSQDNRVAGDEEYEKKWKGAIRMDHFTPIVRGIFDIEKQPDIEDQRLTADEREAKYANVREEHATAEKVLGSSFRRDAARNMQFGETFNIILAGVILAPLMLLFNFAVQNGMIRIPQF